MCSQPRGRRVRKAFGGHWRPLSFERRNCQFQIDGIPENDRGNHKIESAGLVVQIISEPITNRAAPVKENRPSERIARFIFVQTEMDPTPEIWALNPFQRE